MIVKLSMQTKLNGAEFQGLITYPLSLVQVIPWTDSGSLGSRHIKRIQNHTKRMTTSNFSGCAEHDWQTAQFNIRRSVFERFPILLENASSIYQPNKATHISQPNRATASSMRQSFNAEFFRLPVSNQIPSNRCCRRYPGVPGCSSRPYSNIQFQLKATPVCAGLQFKQMNLEMQSFKSPDAGHSDRPILPVLRVPHRASDGLYSSKQ